MFLPRPGSAGAPGRLRRPRRENRLAQRIEEARRRRDHLVAAQEFVASGEVAHAAAGFA